MQKITRALSFNDVLCVPQYSDIKSRSQVNLSTKLAGIQLKLPIVAAPMSAVCETAMAQKLGELGGLGIIHRFCSTTDQAELLRNVHDVPVGFAIGIDAGWEDRMHWCHKYAQIACIDVAHGYTEQMLELLATYFKEWGGYPLIISQLSSAAAADDIVRNAVPQKFRSTVALRGSVGGGSHCSTRIMTGHGLPTLQWLMDVDKLDLDVSIIADGGIKTPAHCVLALAAGADAVMLGYLLAGTDECPGNIVQRDNQLYKNYYGSASFAQKSQINSVVRNVEGESSLVPYQGSLESVIHRIQDGLASGLSYSGAHSIRDLQLNCEFVEVTHSGYVEGTPHGVQIR